MEKFEDYYKILQVHAIAEKEIIDSAYKRLARKYHQDNLRTGSESKMKKLNEAYSILGDVSKRERYDIDYCRNNAHNKPDRQSSNEWSEHYVKFVVNGDKAKEVLNQYFNFLSQQEFMQAYHLLTNKDKKAIKKEDFIQWQSMVSKIFELKQWVIEAENNCGNTYVQGFQFQQVIQLKIDLLEQNHIMERTEADEVVKEVVLEDGEWRVYLGYDTLEPLITRFKRLTNLRMSKWFHEDVVNHYSKRDIDTGLLNRKGLLERIEDECYRYNRYKTVFSFIIAKVETNDPTINQKIAGILVGMLRKLDVVARWDEQTFIVLLPEIVRKNANIVIKKIKNATSKYTKLKLLAIEYQGGNIVQIINNAMRKVSM